MRRGSCLLCERTDGVHGIFCLEPTKSLWVKIKERTGKGYIIVCVCCRPPDQEEQVDEAFYRQLKVASRSLALVLTADVNHTSIC